MAILLAWSCSLFLLPMVNAFGHRESWPEFTNQRWRGRKKTVPLFPQILLFQMTNISISWNQRWGSNSSTSLSLVIRPVQCRSCSEAPPAQGASPTQEGPFCAHTARELINNPKYEPVQCGYRQGYHMNGALSGRDCNARDKGSRSRGGAGWARLAKSVSKKVFNFEVRIEAAIFDFRKKSNS